METKINYINSSGANASSPATVTWTMTSTFEGNPKELRPEKIIFNGLTTIVIWNDGSKTKSTCDEHDNFDEKIGFASCLLKKMYGKKVHGKRLFDRMLDGAEHQYGTK